MFVSSQNIVDLRTTLQSAARRKRRVSVVSADGSARGLTTRKSFKAARSPRTGCARQRPRLPATGRIGREARLVREAKLARGARARAQGLSHPRQGDLLKVGANSSLRLARLYADKLVLLKRGRSKDRGRSASLVDGVAPGPARRGPAPASRRSTRTASGSETARDGSIVESQATCKVLHLADVQGCVVAEGDGYGLESARTG